jgi:hypothetical protein
VIDRPIDHYCGSLTPLRYTGGELNKRL